MLAHEIHGNGTTLALLHGFPLDRRIWSDVIPELAKSMRVIAIDLLGFGQSKSSEPFTLAEQAQRVYETLLELQALPVVLGGLSMGGYVSIAFARQFPAALLGLLLIDTRADGDSPERKIERKQMIDLVRQNGPPAIADRMLPRLVSASTVKNQPDVVDRLRGIMENSTEITIEHALEAMRDREDFTDFLPSIAVPCRVIVGESDLLSPSDIARKMRDSIPNCDLVEIRGAGHMTPMEKPEDVSASIAEFVSSLV